MSNADYKIQQKKETAERDAKVIAEYRELKKTLSQYGAFDILSIKYGRTIDTIRGILFNKSKRK